MKKIYSGETIAVAVLDSPDEIAVVVEALRTHIQKRGWHPIIQTEDRLLAELTAPAPS